VHPVLIKLGPFTIYTYGFFIAAAILMALAFTSLEAKKKGLNPKLTSELGFYALIGALLGARLFFVLLNFNYFLKHPVEILMFWKGGLVFLGGALGATLSSYFFFKRYKQPLLPWADALAPGIALGQAIGRWGCFFAGCCYGKPTHVPWSITFTNPDSLAPLFVPLHPTQIYHSLAGFITFGLLLLSKKWFKKDGQIFALLLILYAIFRFGIEFLRGDYRGEILFLSATQVIALLVFFLGLFLLLRKKE
jgi:phosphatidylglycerol:prolipoprotein diacylglycerol transferase